MPIALEPIAAEMSEAAARLRERRDEQLGQIARNRYVVHNAWVVAGTRIPTLAIWNYHEAGYTAERSSKSIRGSLPKMSRRQSTSKRGSTN